MATRYPIMNQGDSASARSCGDYLRQREGLAMLVLDSTDAAADAALFALRIFRRSQFSKTPLEAFEAGGVGLNPDSISGKLFNAGAGFLDDVSTRALEAADEFFKQTICSHAQFAFRIPHAFSSRAIRCSEVMPLARISPMIGVNPVVSGV